jgi:hypothetical protein
MRNGTGFSKLTGNILITVVGIVHRIVDVVQNYINTFVQWMLSMVVLMP